MTHVTKIGSKSYPTELETSADYGGGAAGWIECFKARGMSDEQADAELDKHVLDSVKLERNARVRGKVVKVIEENRVHSLLDIKANHPELHQEFTKAVWERKEDEYLDTYAQRNQGKIAGWKDPVGGL